MLCQRFGSKLYRALHRVARVVLGVAADNKGSGSSLVAEMGQGLGRGMKLRSYEAKLFHDLREVLMIQPKPASDSVASLFEGNMFGLGKFRGKFAQCKP